MSPYRHRLRTQALAAALLLAVSTVAPARPKTPAKATVTHHVTHAGKSGTVRDVNTSKTGQVTITVVQANGERFKTLAKNVVVKPARPR